MFVEFGRILLHAIEKTFDTEVLTYVGLATSPDRFTLSHYDILGIEVCPEHIGDTITSNVCFRLADALSHLRIGAPVNEGPLDLAHRLLPLVPRDLFVMSIGGRGYLNGSPTVDYEEKIFQLMLEVSPYAFFSGSSFFEPITEVEGLWDIAKACERCIAEEEPRIGEVFLSRREKYSLEDRMMLLGLLGDGDLDVDVYLRELGGRQNIPWYVRRFVHDSTRYLAFLDESLGGLPPMSTDRPEMFGVSRELFFAHRHCLLTAMRANRPERFFNHILSHIRDFYRIFNDPRYRASIQTPLSSTSLKCLRKLVEQRFWIVALGLEHLFGPEVKDFLR